MEWQPLASALLNATAFFFLLLGYFFIRTNHPKAHRFSMLIAVGISTLFLGNYVVYHSLHGSTPYSGVGIWRKVYFSVLLTHIVCSTLLLPCVLRTLLLAFRSEFEKHKTFARFTLALWLYVSVTGVLIYCFVSVWI